jgi:hypothetical protein
MKRRLENGRIVAGARAHVHGLLHLGRQVHRGQCGVRRPFPTDPPARVFASVPVWPGHFDIDIDCVAAVASTNAQGG